MSTPSSNHNKGQGLVEYALILVLVSVIAIAVMMVLGPTIGNVFSNINDSLARTGASGVIPVTAATATTPPSGQHIPASGGVCPPGSHGYHTHSDGSTWCRAD